MLSSPSVRALLLSGNLARKFPMMIDLTGHEVSNIEDLDFSIWKKQYVLIERLGCPLTALLVAIHSSKV